MIVLLAVLAAACGDDAAPAGRAEPATPATRESATPAPAAIPAPVLDAYEATRAALAADRLDPALEEAARLEAAATAAASSAPERHREHYQALATATARLRESPRGDATEIRRSFGEVSRHLVGLVHADPALGRGLHVFECPMAIGYRKWVQPRPELSNPYMGTSMPSCGAASDWAP